MATIVSTALRCHLGINCNDWGVEETFWLREQDWDQAIVDCLLLAEARALVMAEGAEIMWVGLATAQYPRVTQGLMQGKLFALKKPGGAPYWAPVNTAYQTLCFHWKTDVARHYNLKHLYFIADDETQDDRWSRERLDFSGATPPKPIAPGTAPRADIWRYALGTIRDLTLHTKILPDLPGGVHQFEQREWSDVCFSGLSSQPTKRKLQRFTWEARDSNYPPHFSPCGCAVWIRRSMYEAGCRFYAGGVNNGIRYYFSRDGAAILPHKTIFNGWYGVKGLVNGGGAGELTGAPVVPWHPGWSWSNAPGIAPTGGPNAFLGLSVAPFDETEPTPDIFKPGCDMATPMILVDEDDGSPAIDNALHLSFDHDDFEVDETAANHATVHLRAAPFELEIGNDPGSGTMTSIDTILLRAKDGITSALPTAKTITIGIGDPGFWNIVWSPPMHNLDPNDYKAIVFVGSGSTGALTGIRPTSTSQHLRLINATGAVIVLAHEDSGSTAAHRFHLRYGNELPLQPNEMIDLWYLDLRWRTDGHLKWVGEDPGTQPAGYLPVPVLQQSPYDSWGETVGPGNLFNGPDGFLVDGAFAGKVVLDDVAAIGPLNPTGIHYNVNQSGSSMGIQGLFGAATPGTLFFYSNDENSVTTFAHDFPVSSPYIPLKCPGGVDLELNQSEGCILGFDGTWWHVIATSKRPTATLVTCEIPTGTVNGSNANFTLAHVPTGSVMLFRNGVLQLEGGGNDFIMTDDIITFATPPTTGDVLLASYQY